MPEFQWRAFQGQGETWTNTLNISGFAGTEPLTASIYKGNTQAAVLTVTPAWNTSVNQTTPPTLIDTSITGVQFNAMIPGAYFVLIGVADGSAALQKGFLDLYPAPGGTPPLFERALTTPAQLQAIFPSMSQDEIDYLPFAIRAATRHIETYCQHPLVLDSYDHVIRPSNSIRLRLRSRPVVEVSRVASTLSSALMMSYGGSAQMASVRTATASPTSMAIVALTFSATDAGVTTSTTINVTTYPTFDLLAAAINALGGGWSATVAPMMGSWPTSEAFGTPGTRGAIREQLDLTVYSQPLGQFWIDADRGWLEVNESVPGGFLVPNPRVERYDTRRFGVRCSYRAGYATTVADVALGCYPVPEDLEVATAITARSIAQADLIAGPVKTQSVKDRSYTLKDSYEIIPDAAKSMLASYIDVVF